jgi:hypothetical protein
VKRLNYFAGVGAGSDPSLHSKTTFPGTTQETR